MRSGQIPRGFFLEQNYPNPFNLSTAIGFQLPAVDFATLRVYDALGREIARLPSEEKAMGAHTVTWDARDLPSGVYVYRLVAGNHVDSKKMLLIK